MIRTLQRHIAGFVFLVLVILPGIAVAAPYGSGSYDSSTYGSGSSSTPPTSNPNPTDDTTDDSGESGSGKLVNTGEAIILTTAAALTIGVLSTIVMRAGKKHTKYKQ